MKRLVLATLIASLPLGAHAADLYTGPTPSFDYASPAPASAGFDWAGFYIGGNAGYLWADSYLFNTFAPWSQSGDFDRDGFIGGGQIGYNFQAGPWVLGVEADIQYSDASGSGGDCTPACGADLEWFGTVRGRVGYAMNRLLLYATGGWAYGGVNDTCFGCGPLPLDHSETLTGGWAAGGGLEYGFASNWTAKVEYLYMDLGSSASGFPDFIGGNYDGNHIVRGGINFLFN